MLESPFNLDNNETYWRWRDKKLRNFPKRIEELFVEIDDPRNINNKEFEALRERCLKANMAFYTSNCGSDSDPEIPLAIGERFCGVRLSKNFLADIGTTLIPLGLSN